MPYIAAPNNNIGRQSPMGTPLSILLGLPPSPLPFSDPPAPNQLWVSDITYIEVGYGFVYLSLITDAYSRKIVGWNLSRDISTGNALKALKQALTTLPSGSSLIHHSDRGVQYCSVAYVKELEGRNILISMTENGDPLENAIAERVNGILKNEWIDKYHLTMLYPMWRRLLGFTTMKDLTRVSAI